MSIGVVVSKYNWTADMGDIAPCHMWSAPVVSSDYGRHSMRLSHPWHTSWHMARVTRDRGDHWWPGQSHHTRSRGRIYATVYNEQLVRGNTGPVTRGVIIALNSSDNQTLGYLIVTVTPAGCMISICFPAVVTSIYFIFADFSVWHIPGVWYKVVTLFYFVSV